MKSEEQFDLLLGSLSRSKGVENAQEPCPAPEAFWDAISGALSLQEVLSLSEHAARCPICREAWELTRDMFRESGGITSAFVGAEPDPSGAGSATLVDMVTRKPSKLVVDSESSGESHVMDSSSVRKDPNPSERGSKLRVLSIRQLQRSPQWLAVAAAFAVVVGLSLEGTFSPSSTQEGYEDPVWRNVKSGNHWEKVSQDSARLCWEALAPEYQYYVVLLDSDLQIISERFVARKTCLDLNDKERELQPRYWRVKAQTETGLEVLSPSFELRT